MNAANETLMEEVKQTMQKLRVMGEQKLFETIFSTLLHKQEKSLRSFEIEMLARRSNKLTADMMGLIDEALGPVRKRTRRRTRKPAKSSG